MSGRDVRRLSRHLQGYGPKGEGWQITRLDQSARKKSGLRPSPSLMSARVSASDRKAGSIFVRYSLMLRCP